MALRWLPLVAAAVLPGTAAAQPEPACRFVCRPAFLIEPTWTIENLARRPRVEDAAGEVHRLERETLFELVLAVDIPTRLKRLGFTSEASWSPGAPDNAVELEFEANFHVLLPEQTGGWVSSHVDVVDQFSPATHVTDRSAYTHKLDFELDTAVALFERLPVGSWLKAIEVEVSLDYLATGLPRRGEQADDMRYIDRASPWSLSFVLVVPLAR